jgi:hypothetical protein
MHPYLAVKRHHESHRVLGDRVGGVRRHSCDFDVRLGFQDYEYVHVHLHASQAMVYLLGRNQVHIVEARASQSNELHPCFRKRAHRLVTKLTARAIRTVQCK